MSNGIDFNVPTSKSHITWNIAIDGDTVVWCDSRNTTPQNDNDFDFYGYNISTQTESVIWADGEQRPGIDIYGDIVVGVERSYQNLTSYDIYGYDLSTQTRFLICDAPNYQYEPRISGDVVVWWDRRTGDWEVYGYDFSTATEFLISPGEYCAISNDIVVFETSGNIYGYDLSTDNVFTITENAGYQYAPVISENFVVWADDRNGDYDIYGYDLLTQTEFPIATGIGNQKSPSISGNVVVWADDRNGNWDIYGATISEISSEECIVFEDFEDGDVTINPTWYLYHTNPEVGQGMIASDPIRSGNLVYKGYGTPTGHRVLQTPLDPQIPWDSFNLSMEFMATQGYFSIWYGFKNDNYEMGVGIWYDNRSPGHTDYVVLGIHEAGFTPESWALIPKSQFSYNKWYKVDCWYDSASGVIRARLSLLETGQIIAQVSRVPTIDYSLEPGIALARFGIEELQWQYVDNFCLASASVPEPTSPPIADANGPYTIYVDDPLTLDANDSRDDDNDIVSYMWDLDDNGTFETDANDQAIFDVNYTYLHSLGLLVDNTYNIHLQVTDSEGQSDTNDTTLTIIPKPALEVAVDIKPGSCPNPMNVKSSGVLPVAILGSDIFDVNTIIPSSVQLNGVGVIRNNYEDVSSPVSDINDCNCISDGLDGFIDLTLKFKTQDIVEAIGDVNDGDILSLELTGVLFGERPIEGTDCIVIRGRHKPFNQADINKDGKVDMTDFAIFSKNWLQSSIVE